MEDIGKRIRELRKMAGMTQQELADAIGRTKSSVKKYEAGQVAVSVKLAEKMAEVLGAPIFVYEDLKPEPAKVIYLCDGNVETCRKTFCYRKGGPCWHTSDPDHAVNFVRHGNTIWEINPHEEAPTWRTQKDM